jgi:hypothetical protein
MNAIRKGFNFVMGWILLFTVCSLIPTAGVLVLFRIGVLSGGNDWVHYALFMGALMTPISLPMGLLRTMKFRVGYIFLSVFVFWLTKSQIQLVYDNKVVGILNLFAVSILAITASRGF